MQAIAAEALTADPAIIPAVKAPKTTVFTTFICIISRMLAVTDIEHRQEGSRSLARRSLPKRNGNGTMRSKASCFEPTNLANVVARGHAGFWRVSRAAHAGLVLSLHTDKRLENFEAIHELFEPLCHRGAIRAVSRDPVLTGASSSGEAAKWQPHHAAQLPDQPSAASATQHCQDSHLDHEGSADNGKYEIHLAR